jgi:hypothetical protein
MKCFRRYLCCICSYYERKRIKEIYSTLNCIDEEYEGDTEGDDLI